jgi:cell division protein FtsI (penicillin-binding protein 3)
MTRQSRLRVQKGNNGRRLLLYLLLIALLSFLGYYFDRQYSVVDSFQRLVERARNIFSQPDFTRGTIYDRNLKQIAITMERVSVYVRTREVDSITDTAIALASTLSLDSNQLINQMESGALRLWVAEDISQEQERAVKQLNLPGVFFQKEEKRYYPNGSQAAHLIGFVEDGIGLSGVEYHYDRLLASRKLKQQSNSLVNGQDIVLTIDLKIQKIVEDLIREISEAESAVKVGAYLLESGSGKIIAGSQYPSFNPNSFTRYNSTALENMFFEPLLLPDNFRLLLRDSASFYADNVTYPSPGMWAAATASPDLGSQLRLWEWLKLGENWKTDFFSGKKSDLSPGPGQVRSKSDDPGFGLIPEMATPISILNGFSVLLDGEFRHKPFVVDKALDSTTGEQVFFEEQQGQAEGTSEIVGFPSQPLATVKGLFESLNSLPGSFGGYLRDEILVATPVASGIRNFHINDLTLVSIPAEPNPLMMLVVIEREPQGPTRTARNRKQVEEILEARMRRISILQQVAGTVEDVLEREVTSDGNYKAENDSANVASKAKEVLQTTRDLPEIMPDLVGMSLRKSLRMLQGYPVALSIEGTGKVIRQQPAAGTPLAKVDSFHLILEKQQDMTPEKISKELRK